MKNDIPVVPDIYHFNPSCDFATGNASPHWQPGKLVRKMEYELGNLPQFLCNPEDLVLTAGMPSARLLETLSKAGFAVPRFIPFDPLIHTSPVLQEPAGWLRPWGWSPATHQQLKSFKPYCSRNFLESPMAEWNSSQRDLFSRDTAAIALKMILEEYRNPSFLEPDMLPLACKTLPDIEHHAGRWGKVMVKMPWSSSGRGLQPITRSPLHPSVAQRLSGMLNAQGHVLAEPLHHKAADLAFLYEVTGNTITLLGYSRFFTDNKGQYKGNFLNGWPDSFPGEVKKLASMAEACLPELHIRILERLNISQLYRGPLGIDVLIFRDKNACLKINPCQEINWRYTMGNISLTLENSMDRLSHGTFEIVYDPRIPFREKANILMGAHPPEMREGKLYSGLVPLTEFTTGNHFGAFIRTSPAH